MHDKHAICVDAGYLMAAAAQVIAGTSLRRSIIVDWTGLVDAIKDEVAALTDSRLLRVLWYDAARPGNPGETGEHSVLALLPDVKVRLGRLNIEGAQKGVDTRIALDMVNMAVRGAVSSVFLVSGDDDLTEAVDVAQEYGVRVVLFNVPDENSRLGVYGTALHLAKTVDARRFIALDTLKAVIAPARRPDEARPDESPHEGALPPDRPPTPLDLSRRKDAAVGRPEVQPAPRPAGLVFSTGGPMSNGYQDLGAHDADADLRSLTDVADKVVQGWLASASMGDLDELTANRPTIPAELDRTLLMDLVGRGGDRFRYLAERTRHDLREAFWEALDRAVQPT